VLVGAHLALFSAPCCYFGAHLPFIVLLWTYPLCLPCSRRPGFSGGLFHWPKSMFPVFMCSWCCLLPAPSLCVPLHCAIFCGPLQVSPEDPLAVAHLTLVNLAGSMRGGPLPFATPTCNAHLLHQAHTVGYNTSYCILLKSLLAESAPTLPPPPPACGILMHIGLVAVPG
jgi:hypothetical protein